MYTVDEITLLIQRLSNQIKSQRIGHDDDNDDIYWTL